jgi:hypothetical protein
VFEGECWKWYKHLLTWPLDGSSIPCMMTGPRIIGVYFYMSSGLVRPASPFLLVCSTTLRERFSSHYALLVSW